MRKIFAGIDTDGYTTGFYCSDIHEDIPEAAIEISEEQWKLCIAHQNYRYINGGWEQFELIPRVKEPQGETDTQKMARLETENTDLKGRVSDMELAFADLITGGGV